MGEGPGRGRARDYAGPEGSGFLISGLGAQVGSKLAHVGSMLAPCRLLVVPRSRKMSQDASKLAPRGLKIALCWLKLASRRPKWPSEASKKLQECFGKASRCPKNQEFLRSLFEKRENAFGATIAPFLIFLG